MLVVAGEVALLADWKHWWDRSNPMNQTAGHFLYAGIVLKSHLLGSDLDFIKNLVYAPRQINATSMVTKVSQSGPRDQEITKLYTQTGLDPPPYSGRLLLITTSITHYI